MTVQGPDSLAVRLAGRIADHGPIPLADYMAEANAHYYAARDPLGPAGDFITAPEISQMFGELVGLWLADLWDRAGRPTNARYVELGPGRGTLAADALRAMRGIGLDPPVDLVEFSPALRRVQAERLPPARWHDSLDTLPEDAPLLVVANEFFDALPIRQFVATEAGWRERMVDHDGTSFGPVAGSAPMDAEIPASLRVTAPGTIVETAPAAAAMAGALARRLARQSGAALVVDYGHVRTAAGDTFQAVSAHAYADPWAEPGTRDLTAHVDFEALGAAARAAGAMLHGPVAQGAWLGAMGIGLRAAALASAAPDRAAELAAARDRLVAAGGMGSLFKVVALTAPDWPEPVGFA